MTRPVVVLCMVGAALAAVLGGAAATAPERNVELRSQSVPDTVPVESANLVCPRTSAFTNTTNRIAVVAPSGTATGHAVVRSADATKQLPALALDRPGSADVVEPRGVAADPVVEASGSIAAGVVAESAQRVDGGFLRGIAGARCVAPTTETWFLGAASTVGRFAVLTLTNVDPLAATVDVTFDGPNGPVDAPTARGLTIQPGASRQLKIQEAVPNQRDLIVHVKTRAGRVAAFLFQRYAYARTPGGIDYLPPMDGPQLESVAPALPNGLGARWVVIGNPGDDDATVKLSLVTSDGTFVPDGLSAISVPAHSTRSVSVTVALAQQAGAVKAESDLPVLLAAVADTGPRVRGIGEFAWSAAVPPLEGPTPVAITTLGAGESTLFLSAPEESGTVLVTTYPVRGATVPAPRRVRVSAGRTVSLELSPGTKGSFSVVLEVVNGAGPIYAARELLEIGARGPLYTIEPVRSGRGTALLRPVVADPAVSRAS